MSAIDNQMDSTNQTDRIDQRECDSSAVLLGDIWACQPPHVESDNGRLIAQLGSTVFAQRHAATLELQRRGLCALPDLLRAHNHSDPEINGRISQLIDRIGTGGIPMMLAATQDDDPQLRAGATRSLARLPIDSILDYCGETNQNQERIQQSRRVLATRTGWEDRVSELLVRDSEMVIGPRTAQEYRRAVTAAQLLNRHPHVMQLSLEEGRFLLDRGHHREAIDSLDRSLDTLSGNLANHECRILFAVDIAQQLRDHLESTDGQLLPQRVRAAVTLRMERAQAFLERQRERREN